MKYKGFYGVLGLILAAGLSVTPAPCAADEADVESIPLTPAALPVPALQYRFWPSVGESKSINAMPMFMRACLMMEQGGTPEMDQELDEVYASLIDGKWSNKLRGRAERLLGRYKSVQAELERATNCMDTHFDLNIGQQGLVERVSLVLPEVQISRRLARLLVIRAHLESRHGDWDSFSRTVTSLFRLAEMTGYDNAFIVGRLVRYAIVSVTLELIEDASALKGCPNFYWALASVPEGLLEIQGALQWERENPLIVFGVNPLPEEPIGSAAAVIRLRESIEILRQADAVFGTGSIYDQGNASIVAGLYVVGNAEGCREILRSDPKWGQRADSLSDAEAVYVQIVGNADDWSMISLAHRTCRPKSVNPSLKKPNRGFRNRW